MLSASSDACVVGSETGRGQLDTKATYRHEETKRQPLPSAWKAFLLLAIWVEISHFSKQAATSPCLGKTEPTDDTFS